MPTLYEIATEYQWAAEKLAELDLDEQCVADTLESLSGTLQEKCTNVAKFVRNQETFARNIREAAKQMQHRAEMIENRAERIREYLKGQMERTGLLKIECPYFVLQIKKNPPSVLVVDEAAIPDDYWKQKPPPPKELDKALIKEVLRVQPDKVPGAKLVQGTRLEIK